MPPSASYTLLLILALAATAPSESFGQESPRADVKAGDRTEAQPAIEFTWADRRSVTFGEHLRIGFRGRIQVDSSRSEVASATSGGGADVEKQRVGIEGSFGKILDFEVSRELTDARPWRDAYVDYRQFTAARLQAGRFKLPFSLDENTGAGNLDFVNRSMAASALAPGRDQGVMLHGRLWGRALSYEAGVFAHDGDNARPRDEMSVSAGRTAAFRVSSMVGGKNGVHTALAVATTDVPSTVWTIAGRTTLDATFFPASLWVQGTRRRIGVEARWVGGPVSLQSEYMRLTQERLSQSVQGGALDPVVASGWYISGTWALTGERKAKRLQSQARSVFQGGRGAVEVAARVEALTFGQLTAGNGASASPRAETVLGNRDVALTLGANWYLSPHLKLQANVIRDALRDPLRGPLPTQPAYWSSVVRLQVGM